MLCFVKQPEECDNEKKEKCVLLNYFHVVAHQSLCVCVSVYLSVRRCVTCCLHRVDGEVSPAVRPHPSCLVSMGLSPELCDPSSIVGGDAVKRPPLECVSSQGRAADREGRQEERLKGRCRGRE